MADELFRRAIHEAKTRRGYFSAELIAPSPGMYNVVQAVGYGQLNAAAASQSRSTRRPDVAACELCASGGGEFVDFQGQQIVMCEPCRKAVA